MFWSASQNPHWPLDLLRDNLLSVATQTVLLHPNIAFYTIEQMYRAIDYVIEQETAEDPTSAPTTTPAATTPTAAEPTSPTTAATRPRVHDPGNCLKQLPKETKRAVMKQRACDLFKRSTKNNTAIIKRIHDPIDYIIDRRWQDELEKVEKFNNKDGE